MVKEIELKNMDAQKSNPEAQSKQTEQKKKETDKKSEESGVPFSQLFRFASRTDWILILLGCLGSGVNGAAMPLFSLLFGDVADDFSQPDLNRVVDAAGRLSLKLFLVGIGSLVASYFSFACWMIAGERQTIEIRKRYFKSLLEQEIAFFDSINPNELSTKIAEECFSIQGGIGEKVSTFIFSLSMFVIGFVIGYIKGWQLALVLTGFMPVISITGGLFVYAIQKQTKINAEAYSRAGAISEEVLNAIRTVVSLGGQSKETKRYQVALDENKRAVVRFVVFAGCAMGGIFMAMFAVYALGFFVGSIFIENKVTNPVTDAVYTGGDVLTVFFSIIMAGFSTSQAAPAMKSFAIAKAAGAKAFKIIDRKSQISIQDPKGLKPSSITGNIRFQDVTFAYPGKPDRIILDGISFDIRMNEKTAFVGESGCGKTTCMQLIERFYDIGKGNGSIKLDGNEIKDLNLKWFRENIGYVGQEPVLFATSIRENLLMAQENATDEQIWEALKKANADKFVNTLPEKLNTYVGTNGAMLSGGQKQRLAIARAILKNPKILLLDEATSALDRKNEMEIQKTLDEISEGRTTIVIAHRLSTIINADHIIVFDQGKVVEEGRHEELVEKRGRYYALQHLQLQTNEKEKVAQNDDDVESPLKNEEDNLPQIPVEKKASKKIPSSHADPKQDVQIKVDDGQNKDAAAKGKGKKGKKDEPDVFGRLFTYNKKERPLLALGIAIALLNGAIFPCLAILLSNILEVFAETGASDFRRRANILSLMFLILAILSFICNAFQLSIMSVVGENLSRKVRIEVFQKYLKMPMGWFDLPENSPGALAAKLSKDASLVNTLTSSVLGIFTQALSSFITGMIIAFVASWQLTLVSLALSPLMILAGKMQAQLNQGFSADTDGPYQESVAFVAEAVNNMRTVASFGNEEKLLENYSKKLEIPLRGAVKKGNLSGLAFGFSQFCNFGIYAAVFYIGAIFMRDIDLGFQEMLQSIFGIMFAAFGTGNAFQFAPDLGAAKNAAISVFKILDEKPAIDIDDPSQNVRTPITGNIEFRNVSFKYPSREKQIFKNLSFKVEASKKVALVGPSGCGKSTILALLQRFYDADQGEILIDGVDIKKYDLAHLRHCYGVVSQEPVLFNGTIEYNVKYAKDTATDTEMKEAARKANALSFIEKSEFDTTVPAEASTDFGQGFQRKVGPKGSQLSGGQKQRIAIARAILKNPSVLILDEATSALDAQNEKSVQESLDQIMQGKTSVIVAHRISTIKDADEILVFNDGEIIERGNYQQLNQMQGMFYKLERGMDLGAK